MIGLGVLQIRWHGRRLLWVNNFGYMNSSNAVAFVVLGSLMNAVPTVAPQIFTEGILIADMTPSALWLRFMGLVVGLIGGSHLLREGIASIRIASRATLARVRTQTASANGRTVASRSLQTA